MELNEIYETLLTLGVPAAYFKFAAPQHLPFIIYREDGSEIKGADGYDLFRDVTITIELYSDRKRPDLERLIENAFRSFELHKGADIYIKDEDMLMTAYSFDVIQKI